VKRAVPGNRRIFTPRARQAVFFSRYEAAGCGRRVIEPEDVLLGAIRAAAGGLRSAFERAGVTVDRARAEMSDATGIPIDRSVEIPFESGARDVFRLAGAEADRLAQREIGVAHLVLALLRYRSGPARSFLESTAIRVETVRQAAGSAAVDDSI
jgi:ATP-dependent Clp protease ATP-binding subunit ClpA